MNEIMLDLISNEVENDKKNAISLGCGTGDAEIKLAKLGMTVIGTDWSPEASIKTTLADHGSSPKQPAPI